MTCPDLCTAEKCRELEGRIGALEQALELLEAAFEAHTNQAIPIAHNYTPYVKVDLRVDNYTLACFVAVDDYYGFDQVELPPPPDPDVAFDIFALDDGSYVFKVQVNGESDEDTLTLPQSNLSLDGSFTGDLLTLTVADGESQDTTQITIPLPEQTEHVESNLKLSASYVSDILTISIADGESQDTAQVFIDADVINNFGGGGSNVSCDNISNDIQTCCNNISSEIQDCCSQILTAIDNISNQVRTVEQEITIDITDTVNSDYECVENEVTKVIEPKLVPKTISNKGLLGLHEHLKLMSANLDAIFKPLCDLENETVVSIVASDKVIPNASGKLLVLHFVTLENYPKRSRNSTYWQIHIPAARDSYVWNDDFLDLRFNRGNQYAELRFNEFKNPVSGWFADITAADNYFDAVLGLTIATEKNRVYPVHKTPQTNVTPRITRPYRAFIESVNSQGEAECHIKYIPTDENGDAL